MNTLAIDIETFSSTDLIKSGVYKYVQAPDFSIMLFAYCLDNGPIQIIDLAQGEELPTDILNALQDDSYLKTAFNANFERVCINQHLRIQLPPMQWECTSVKASMLGLPLNLDSVAKALKLSHEKSPAGKALIRYFSLPCKPTKSNSGRLRNLPEHDPVKWQEFKNYCVQDVVVEQAIRNKISFFNIPEKEKKLWYLDQRVNDQGVLLDPQFVKNAIQLDIIHNEKMTKEAVELTKLDNPNSAAQLKRWLSEEIGDDISSLTKESIPTILQKTNCDVVKRVLQIRQEMSKTSIKKYIAMYKAICKDNRVRGLLQFYGANRTGRWAGRLVQVQNLPRNEMECLDIARQLVKNNDLEMLEILFANIPDTLSQLIRTSFIAPPGHRFRVADFAAIEARIVAWLAGEKWRLEVFKTHGKIYEASAAQMFKVPITDITKGSPLRQKGKVAELALGFGGGPNALMKMGALKMGIPEEELPKLVAMWRNANQAIVSYWDTVDDAAREAIETRSKVTINHGISFFVERNILFIQLPSGRKLSYLRPKLKPGKFGGTVLTYEGLNQTTKQWGIQETYGGKLFENIVQAIARDCLGEAMIRVDEVGYNIVLHVHDEIVTEDHCEFGSTEEIDKIMSEPISWAPGLPLAAESYETEYYKKD